MPDAHNTDKLWLPHTCSDQIDKESGSPFVQSQGLGPHVGTMGLHAGPVVSQLTWKCSNARDVIAL